MVHRLIKNIFNKRKAAPNKEEYEIDCHELSELERQAEKISKTSKKEEVKEAVSK